MKCRKCNKKLLVIKTTQSEKLYGHIYSLSDIIGDTPICEYNQAVKQENEQGLVFDDIKQTYNQIVKPEYVVPLTITDKQGNVLPVWAIPLSEYKKYTKSEGLPIEDVDYEGNELVANEIPIGDDEL